MHDHPTHFQAPPETAGRTARRSSFNLPPELLRKARRRLRFLSALILTLCVITTVIELIIGTAESRIVLLLYSAVGVSSCALYVTARVTALGHTTVLRLGLVYEVLICLFISITFCWLEIQETGRPAYLTWTCIWIVVFPLIIPSPPRLTLVVALAAAAASPLTLAILYGFGAYTPLAQNYVDVSISPALCVVIAVACSRVVYGLNVQVAEAMKLGSYQLVEKLGEGGMGEVWKGRHELLARPAAIKLISAQSLAESGPSSAETLAKRFEREAQITAQLESAHTVNVYDFGTADDGAFFYVMELLHGLDLARLVKQFGPVAPERAVHILLQACHSLAEAHEAGLIHRDIKPANIYLCRRGLDHDFVKVLDFGLVKDVVDRTGAPDELTTEGLVAGTPAFIAPEMALGKADVDRRADLYALGCVGYWLLSGKYVFQGETPMATLMMHVSDEPPPLGRRCELELPTGLERLIHDCLAKAPDDRPQTAVELAGRLSALTLDKPWTQERAHQWWALHRPVERETGAKEP